MCIRKNEPDARKAGRLVIRATCQSSGNRVAMKERKERKKERQTDRQKPSCLSTGNPRAGLQMDIEKGCDEMANKFSLKKKKEKKNTNSGSFPS